MVNTGKRSVHQRTLWMVLLSQLGVLMFVLKMIMAGLPNIEPVSLLVMVYAVTLGPWALAPIYIYVFLEWAIWGLNTWSLSYLYIWALFWLISWLLRKMESSLGWAVLCASFGLCFGALCAPIYIPIGGWAYALTWWASGIPFDAIHCAGNFVMALVLFQPLRKLLERLIKKSNLR
ncbi:MAG: hypothetical protein IKC03_05555 [Oscillospiraceae bacterium]|nr:hypothetical protein [Oscillospiraceae bacterium]